MKKILPFLLVVVLVLISVVLYLRQTSSPITTVPQGIEITDQQNVGLANPAAEFCLQSGGTLENIIGAGESANCVFPSGETCEEWALFRGDCTITGMTNLGLFVATETYAGTNASGKAVVFVHHDFTRYTLEIGGVITEGMLNTERGWEDDIDATVFVLNWQDVEVNQRLFVKKTGTTALVQLDAKREELSPTVTLTLSN